MWRRLSWRQRRMLVRASIWLGLVDLGLRVLGLRRLMQLARPVAEQAKVSIPGHVSIYSAVLEVVARNYPVPAHCLHKSIVLHFWLRREGLPSQMRIGVKKEDGQLKAHAWVEVAGQVVNDDPRALASFRVMSAPHLKEAVWTQQSLLGLTIFGEV